MTPIIIVIVSWLILPTIVAEMAFILFSGLRNKILPPNSPVRLGVNIVMLQPANTDFSDFEKFIFSNGDKSNCHFKASKPQFKSNINTTSQNRGSFQQLFICVHLISKSGCWIICLYNK